jgi:hypothetical protein
LLFERFVFQQVIALGSGNTKQMAGSTLMKTQKWLLVNGCEFKGPISTGTEFLKSRQDGPNASIC